MGKGKGGIVLGIIGILIGAGGLGFGFINWGNQSQVRIWNDYESDYFTPAYITYETIPNLNIIVDLAAPAKLYLTFSALAWLQPDPVSYADIIFYYVIDGHTLYNPYTRVGPYKGTAEYDFHSIVLQYYNGTFPGGQHTISVIVWSETTGNIIRECLLTAQSYTL